MTTKNIPSLDANTLSSLWDGLSPHLIASFFEVAKIGDDAYYAQELFESEELFGYLSKNMITSHKSVALRLGKRVRPLHILRILGGSHHEGIRKA